MDEELKDEFKKSIEMLDVAAAVNRAYQNSTHWPQWNDQKSKEKLEFENFKEKAIEILKDIYPNIELKKEDLDLQHILNVMRDYYKLTGLVRPI